MDQKSKEIIDKENEIIRDNQKPDKINKNEETEV